MKKQIKNSAFNKKGSIRLAGEKNKAAILLMAVGVLICTGIALFVLLPKLHKNDGIALDGTGAISPAVIVNPGVTDDLSGLQKEAVIKNTSIGFPCIFGDKIAFSTTSGGVVYNKLYLYDVLAKTSEEVPVRLKYDNILWICMNENYIVYLDAASSGGGRICVYDRSQQQSYVVKEYAYAMPQISLEGDYIAFLQQAGDELDRLYIFNLRTKESVAAKIFLRTPAISPGVYLNEGVLLYSVPYYEGDILKSRVVELSLSSGQERTFDWGRYVYSPKKDGKYIAFLSAATGAPNNLYLSENGGTPALLVENIANYDMGKGFLAYTKDSNVYIYVFENGKTYRLNTAISKGLLANVNGKCVCWYDVTAAGDVDVVKYANVEW